MAVRSNYIKQLMEKKNSLDDKYQEVIAESMKNIIGENAKDEVRQLLKEAEDEDAYEEEEVDDDTATTDEDDALDTDEVDDETEDNADDDIDDEVWDDLENCKSADGEYDCRGMEDDKLVKVLKAMGPEDGIRVMSNGDGTVEIEVDGDRIEGTQEFILDLDDDSIERVDDDFDGDDIENDIENDVDIDDDLDESIEYVVETDLGYGPKQNFDAMTTPPNKSITTDRSKTHEWNPDLASSTSDTRKTGNGDRQPYDDDINECGGLEVEVVEDDGEMLDETEGARPNWNNTRKTLAKDNEGDTQFPRSGSKNGERKKGTGKPVYAPTNESINFKRSMNRLYEENKQMKSIIPQLNKKLMESMVINASMGYIVRLINENTTTSDEKKEISQRFAKVNTLEEGKRLYQTISEELKRANKRNNVGNTINAQLAEGKQSKQSLVETTMYKSEKVNEALDFMKRLDKVK